MSNTCIVLSAFNEAGTVGSIVKRLKDSGYFVLVVDDGSVDNTFSIAQENGADVIILNENNLGKGSSLRKGFDYLIKNQNDFSCVISMDADGQHDPEDVTSLVNEIAKGYDLVIGNRMNDIKNMPFLRRVTNNIMSSVISFKAKTNIPDSQCGFKALSKDLLLKLDLKSLRYEIDSEIILKSAKLKAKIGSVSVKTIYEREKSSINPIIDTLRFLRFIITV